MFHKIVFIDYVTVSRGNQSGPSINKKRRDNEPGSVRDETREEDAAPEATSRFTEK